QLDIDHLQAAVDFARDLGLTVADLELGGKGGLRPAEQRCQHLAGLVGIIVNRLLAEDDEARLFSFCDTLQDLGDIERLNSLVGLDQDGAVGTHGERGAQRFLSLLHANRDDHDFRNFAGFLLAQRFFNRDFVKRVHRHLDIGKINARTVSLHTGLNIRIDHALYGYQDFHNVRTFILNFNDYKLNNLQSRVRSHSNSTSRSLASIWLPGVTCTAFTVPSRSAWRPVSIFIASMVTSRSPGLTFWPGLTLTPAIEPGIGAAIWLALPSCAFGRAATLPFTCRSGTRMTRGWPFS